MLLLLTHPPSMSTLCREGKLAQCVMCSTKLGPVGKVKSRVDTCTPYTLAKRGQKRFPPYLIPACMHE